MNDARIGFLGAGQMAVALARGLVEARQLDVGGLSASDPDDAARKRFAQSAPGAFVTDDNVEVARRSNVLVLAVKPHLVNGVLMEVSEVTSESLVVSIAAGVRLAQLEAAADPMARVVRVMPNTPCLVGMGAAAYALGRRATAEDGQFVADLLSQVARAWLVEERLLDAVTGLSGSGPAFVYTVIEALSDGGVAAGLPRNLASALAVQTVRGAAETVLRTGEHPAVLRDQVASPAGTTVAGLTILENDGIRGTLINAVRAATLRSVELAEE